MDDKSRLEDLPQISFGAVVWLNAPELVAIEGLDQ